MTSSSIGRRAHHQRSGTGTDISCSNLYYDEDGIAWTDLPPDIERKALETCAPHKQCIACGLDELDERHDSLTLIDDDQAFVTGGVTYRRLECAYLYNKDDVFDLVQILSWEKVPTDEEDQQDLKLLLTVRYFYRRNDLTKRERLAGIEGEDWFMDEVCRCTFKCASNLKRRLSSVTYSSPVARKRSYPID